MMDLRIAGLDHVGHRMVGEVLERPPDGVRNR